MTKRPPDLLAVIVLAVLGMVGPFSIDTVFPAFHQLGADYGVDELALQQLVSIYLVSFAVMSLFHGPLSDAVGRKPVVLVGAAIYTAASVAAVFAPTLGVLLATRALQGLSAGAGQIISRAMVRDLFAGEKAQRTMAHISMIFGLAPAAAPIVGGWILGWSDWRGIFWFLAGFGVLMFVLMAGFMPETHPASARVPLRVGQVLGDLTDVVRHPAGRRLALTGAFNFAGMFLYVSSAPAFVFGLLGLGVGDFWVLFVPLIAGMALGSWTSGRLAHHSGRRLASWGYLISLAGGVLNLAVALTPGLPRLPWALVFLPVFTFGVAIAFPILTLAMLEEFPTRRGAASSVQSFASLMLNAVVAGAVAPLLGTSLAGLAAGALAFMVAAWLMWRHHVAVAEREPPTTDAPQAYEPTGEL